MAIHVICETMGHGIPELCKANMQCDSDPFHAILEGDMEGS